MKRGQIMGQPFIYLFYAVVAILVLFLGIKWIISLGEHSEDVEYAVFMKNLKSEIERVSKYNYGSVINLKELKIPMGVEEVCFVSRGVVNQNLDSVTDDVLRGYINATTGEDKNVFFAGERIEAFYVERINMTSSPICDSTLDGEINIKIRNVGYNVSVVVVN
jgi:hypothetical protein